MGKVFDFIAPSAPEAPKLPAAPEPPPTEADKAVVEARKRYRSAIGAGVAQSSTIATSALGLSTTPDTAKKTLLGQ